MRHLFSRWNQITLASHLPTRPPIGSCVEGPPQWTVGRGVRVSKCRKGVFLTLALLLTLTGLIPAIGEPLTASPGPRDSQKTLQEIQTILISGTIQTWLDVPAPPYNVGVTLKLKLQDAGFQVVFDPQQPHDANLRIQYEEIPSGQFQVLEQATAIHYRMELVHDGLGEIFSHQFDAEPNAIPVGSLYWDTISNLEEDPYYCFVGDLIHGYLHGTQNEQDILLEVLVRPFTQQNLVNAAGARGAPQVGVQQRARLNIIQELGQGLFETPEAQEALWTIAKQAQPNERGAAYTQLGKIGDSSFLPQLSRLLEKEDNPEARSAAEYAIQLIESR